MKSPKISVLMPTYNFARYLPEAIESVLQQNFRDFELLIIDDASKDNSAELIKSYAARDSRIRYQINSPNLGMVPNWNLCMEMACGEYVKFLFGDDKLFQPDALEKLLDLMADESVSLAVSARRLLDENSKPIGTWRFPSRPGVKNGVEVIVRCLQDSRNLIGEPSAVLFRKKQALRGFDPRLRQLVDLEFWFHLLEQGNLAYTNEPLCAFRVHPEQQTAVNRASKTGEKELLLLVEEYFSKPYLNGDNKRKVCFSSIYHLRKNRRREPASDLEKKLIQELGKNWYALHWLHRRLTRPFYNLREWTGKRLGNS